LFVTVGNGYVGRVNYSFLEASKPCLKRGEKERVPSTGRSQEIFSRTSKRYVL